MTTTQAEQQFIEGVFEEIKNRFQVSLITYQKKHDTHFIYILPVSVYNSDAFLDFDIETGCKFDRLQFEGLFCFVTKGSLIKLNAPTMVYGGNKTIKK